MTAEEVLFLSEARTVPYAMHSHKGNQVRECSSRAQSPAPVRGGSVQHSHSEGRILWPSSPGLVHPASWVFFCQAPWRLSMAAVLTKLSPAQSWVADCPRGLGTTSPHLSPHLQVSQEACSPPLQPHLRFSDLKHLKNVKGAPNLAEAMRP